MSDSYCCPPGQTCPNWGGGGDTADGGTQCNLDCKAVCDAVAPGVQGGFLNCWRDANDKVSYTCGACGVGRLPSDTKPCPVGETIGDRLARQAYYEAVSVVAFERLVVALERAGAPEVLVARARRAADDEARHASIFRDLAAHHGVSTPELDVAHAAPTLFELAVENASEGCVRETLGAVITMHQAEHAASAEIRAAFAAICDDEAEHAAFSWELRSWFDTRLDARERARVDAAYRAALEAARAEACESPDAPGLAIGLPSAPRTRRMLDLAVEAMSAAA